MPPGVGVLLAYLAGSVPAAYIAGRLKGVDLRQHGSGNLGATNVFRVLGWRIGLAVFLFDTAKGALPVAVLPHYVDLSAVPEQRQWWAIAFGVAAILGHVRPIFLRGKGGGKGVATAGGVFLALAPMAMLVTLGLFALVVFVTGYVSLGSLVAATTLPLILLGTQGARSPVLFISIMIAAFVFWTHRANIGRLRRGQEHRFRTRGAPGSPATAPESVAPVQAVSGRRGRRRGEDRRSGRRD